MNVLPRGDAVLIAREQINAHLAIHSDAARIAVKNKRVFKVQNLAVASLMVMFFSSVTYALMLRSFIVCPFIDNLTLNF